MRIGVNTFQLHQKITGAGRFSKNMLQELARLDNDNEYVIFLRKDNAGYYSIKKENFTNVVVTQVSNRIKLKRIWSEHFLLPKLAREYNVDAFWSPSDIAPARLSCISLVTIHDLKRFVMPKEFPFLERHYYQRFLKKTANAANLIFTGSESSGRDIMTYLGIPPDRIIVAYNGLDPIIYEEEGVPLDTLKRLHGIRGKYILFVGQMIKNKNVPRMIRAFNRCKEAAEYEFVLLGQAGAGMHEIEQTIKRESYNSNLRERIHHIKWAATEHLISLYKYASALFYASLYEGFGFPLVEAMALGVPIITSDCSSMPEVAGDAALLVDPMDEEAMSEALSKIITDEDLQKSLVSKGRERVKQFSWEKTAKKYLAVFDRLKQNS
ncbi:MAG TPA: glycosyltransferase family 1 protein [Candidatus Sumerlaeota bacterium]|nr:MAG: N-acetylgalactosamine-N,N'-diacetylbacillosaminyl-diphospho-undecaprenol 4-alpha-N-acetylgalactosaminyltransferase [candidate division BRC1 bacterium ADurb.Bin183]HOE64158.1 glycosyltransferase family 1 protein [Candidatus Sumerlaeota bacterium]HRR30478.1 glycosyltransferase family 1 protein [Candidatus Sumerlaeia bacterium]HON51056.1 glycosyltransferase family 1 protein [Candidatus Sumerlaeota bacterium]HOR65065.1 glycosyltransferase family 1 protein [Candidatus Sumerlaeota bacterium]